MYELIVSLDAAMGSPKKNITRRRVLASSASVTTAGTLISGSAAAAKHGKEQSESKSSGRARGFEIRSLTDAITIANGKAKVKGWARNSERAEISVTAQDGESAKYSASEFAEHINQGVEKGYWTVKKTAGELKFDLTDKWYNLVNSNKAKRISLRTQDCGGTNAIENGVYYFDSHSLDDIVFGIQGGAGIFTIASIIVGALTTATIGPAVFAVAAVLIGLGGTRLGQIDDGCGIKVDPDASNAVQPQDCDCGIDWPPY